MCDLFFLVLDVHLCFNEKGIQDSGRLNTHNLGEIISASEALFQEILLHVGCGDNLDGLLVEPFNICPEGLLFPLNEDSSDTSDFGCLRETVKCREKSLPSHFQDVMDSSGSDVSS